MLISTYSVFAQKKIILNNLKLDKLNIIQNGSFDYAPGDTIAIPAGLYRGIRFIELEGSQSQPVIIINQGGQVKIEEGKYAGIELRKCKYIKLTGSGSENIKYGISINELGTGSSGGVKLSYLTTDIEVERLEIFNTGFAGIMAKTDPTCKDEATWRKNGYVFRNLIIHDNYIHDTGGEGLYIGYTRGLAVKSIVTCDGQYVFGHWLENVIIYNNILEDLGWDGIQVNLVRKNGFIFNNQIINYGLEKKSSQRSGMSLGGSLLRIYNNYIVNNPKNAEGGGAGISMISCFGPSYIYGNIIINTGTNGVYAHNRMKFEGLKGYYFFNNTIVNPGKAGIVYNACISISDDSNLLGDCQEDVETGFYNNLIINPGTDYTKSNTWKGNDESFIDFNTKSLRNNALQYMKSNVFSRNPDTLYLKDPMKNNYRIASTSSPLYNKGYDVKRFKYTVDIDGVIRPGDGVYDIGAYEYGNSKSGNLPPIVSAGVNENVILPVSNFRLTGSAYDIDGEIKFINWSQVVGPSDALLSDAESLTVKISNLNPGTYIFELNVTDNLGAIGKDRVSINVFSNDISGLVIPKVITPNGDGINDYWEIKNVEALNGCQVLIFDSNGSKVFETLNYRNNWSGRYNGKLLPDGAYYYIIKCEKIEVPLTGGIRIITKH